MTSREVEPIWKAPKAEKKPRKRGAQARTVEEKAAWSRVRAKVGVRDGWRCVWTNSAGSRCQATAFDAIVDTHHVLRRQHGGQDTVENCITLCRPHHDFVHSHPADAIAAGYLLPRPGVS